MNTQLHGRRNRTVGFTAAFSAGALALLVLLPVSASASPPTLEELLARTGHNIEQFWQQFPRVTCSEAIAQTKLDKHDKPIVAQESVADYLVLFQENEGNLVVEESRSGLRVTGKNKKRLPLLITNGFSTTVLIFHPRYQPSFSFALEGEEIVEGKRLLRVRFRHVPESISPAALQLKGKDYPLEFEGMAWLDPDTAAIVRISARLVKSMEEVGLRRLDTDVRYAPMRFAGTLQLHWLPISATIEAETPAQHWRNIHTFSNYRRFTVTTRIVAATEKP